MPGADPTLCSDGRGGVFLSTREYYRFEYFHLGADLFASSPVSGMDEAPFQSPHRAVGPLAAAKLPTYWYPTLAPADSGRAFLLWHFEPFGGGAGERIGRLARDGTRDSTWAWGRYLDTSIYNGYARAAMCSDDSGGVLLAWVRPGPTGGDAVVAARLNARGLAASAWPSDPVLLTSTLGDYDAPGIVPDDLGGAFVVWRDAQTAKLFAQHLTGGGSPAPGWPSSGLQICSRPSQAGIERIEEDVSRRWSSVARDGAGGLYVVWSVQLADGGDIACQHIEADGTLAPGWPVDGLLLCSAPGVQDQPTIAADGAGGAIVTWRDGRNADTHIYAARVTTNGTLAAGWPAGGLRVSGVTGAQRGARLAVVGDGAIVAWEGDRCGSGRIFATRLGMDASLPSIPADTTLAATLHEPRFEGGTVRVVWDVSGTDEPPPVERRSAATDWASVGLATFDADDRVEFRDDSTFAGCGYSYRLGLMRCGDSTRVWSGEAALTVPVAAGFRTITSQLLRASVQTGAPDLAWRLSPGPLDSVAIERSVGNGPMARAGRLLPDSQRVVTFHDPETVPGTLYRYRLLMSTCGHDEVSAVASLTTPGSPIPLPPPGHHGYAGLALGPPSPNPVSGTIWASYSLASESPARIELFDSLGRLRASERLDGAGPGPHLISLGDSRRLGPGIYWLRLQQQTETRIARFAVVQ